MRIGLNLLYLLPGIVGGTETYAKGLLDGLAKVGVDHDFLIFVNREAAEWPLPSVKNFLQVICPLSGSKRWKRYAFEQTLFPKLLKSYKIDVVHSLGYVGPFFTSCRSVSTIHDVNFESVDMPKMRKLSLDFFVRNTARLSNHVITVSQFSKNEIVSRLKISPEKITVVHEAPLLDPNSPEETESAFILAKHDLKLPYILAFSNSFPHKNISGLLQAYVLAQQKYGLTRQLVLVGHRPVIKELFSILRKVKPDSVTFTGYLEHEELRTILRHAELLVFPSFYEGFGLPVLEAMLLGVPVACSNCASLPEVVGNAGIYFDPNSIEDMAKKISQVVCNPVLQEKLRQAGFDNLKRFSWERAARETLEIYQKTR